MALEPFSTDTSFEGASVCLSKGAASELPLA